MGPAVDTEVAHVGLAVTVTVEGEGGVTDAAGEARPVVHSLLHRAQHLHGVHLQHGHTCAGPCCVVTYRRIVATCTTVPSIIYGVVHFYLELLSQRGSMCNCLSRSVPEVR